MCLAQWFFPLRTIAVYEDALATGSVFRMKTQPIDPNDPFRGKYITLSFEASTFRGERAQQWEYGSRVYVALETGDDGFAKIAAVTAEPPLEGDFVEAEVWYSEEDALQVAYPFSRFYMEETKAPAAEELYAEMSRDTTQITYALVRVKNGVAAVEDVLINEVSIREIVSQQ